MWPYTSYNDSMLLNINPDEDKEVIPCEIN